MRMQVSLTCQRALNIIHGEREWLCCHSHGDLTLDCVEERWTLLSFPSVLQ